MNIKINLARYLPMLLLTLSLGAAEAAEITNSNPSIAPVKFATTTVKPWGIRRSGVNQGLLISVIKALEEETGIPVINEMQPYPRVVHSLHGGQVDLAFLFNSDLSRNAAIYIGHLVNSKMIVIGLNGEPALTSLDDLKGKNVGLIRGSRYGPAFDKATHFERIKVSAMEQGVAMLLKKRIDVMVGSDQAIYWAMHEMNIGPKRLSKLFEQDGTSGGLYMSKHSKRQDLIEVYAKALQTLHTNGTIKQIFDAKYEWANAQELKEEHL